MTTLESVPPQPFSLLDWDSDHFGFPIGRITSARITRDLVLSSREWAEKHSVRCLYFLGDPADPQLLPVVKECNFDFVDARVTLQLELPADRNRLREGAVEIRQARECDLPQMMDLAAVSHRDTRFFLDSRFPEARSRDLYRKWIARDVYAERVLVAKPNEDILGYVSLTSPDAENHVSLSLIAVAEKARGQGVGSALLEAALRVAAESYPCRVSVATRAANITAQRLYQSAGFRTNACQYWFHCWLS